MWKCPTNFATTLAKRIGTAFSPHIGIMLFALRNAYTQKYKADFALAYPRTKAVDVQVIWLGGWGHIKPKPCDKAISATLAWLVGTIYLTWTLG